MRHDAKRSVTGRGVVMFVAAIIGGLLVVAAATATATLNDDGPKRVTAEKAPPAEQLPPTITFDKAAFNETAQPLVHGDAFLLAPVGQLPSRARTYGDERDSWEWTSGTASSISELPFDPQVVRTPEMPDGFLLTDITFTKGAPANSENFQLSEFHLFYEHPTRRSITVTIWRPTDLAQGRPYPYAIGADDSPDMVEPLWIGSKPALYKYQKAGSDQGGRQLLLVADGEIMITISTFRGHAYGTLERIALSLLQDGAP